MKELSMKAALIVFLGLTLAAWTLDAQTPAQPAAPAQPAPAGRQTAPAQPAQGGRQTTPAPRAQAARPVPPDPAAMAVNVRIDVVLVDEGGLAPKREVATLTTADRESAFVRNDTSVPNFGRVRFNVDATPFVSGLPAGKIRVRLTLDYWPGPPAGLTGPALAENPGRGGSPTQLQFSLILDDGKPMVASDTSDPSTDRRVRVEVTATILK